MNTKSTLKPWIVAHAGKVVCDLTFVDGDHENSGALRDIRYLARVAAPARHNRLVVDDIHMGPGWAVHQEQLKGRVQVLQKYGPFRPDTLENPCMRAPPGVAMTARMHFELCHPWGFLVARYTPVRST